MGTIIGFLLINIYAFLLILSTTIVFFSKQRLKEFEDETYKKFLIANIFMSLSGLVLGIVVNKQFAFNDFVIVFFNKIYLIALMLWIAILTFYYMYITLKDKINIIRYKKIFKMIAIINALLILILPLDVSVTEGGVVASGAAIVFTYTMFGIGFLVQIISMFSNYKNLKNKKYIPLYLLIFLGAIVLISMMINPALNYLVNPVFVFIAFIMYHTIENPDMQMIETLLRNKELTEATVNDKSNFLFKVSQEMRRPVKNIIDISKEYKNVKTKEEKDRLIEQIGHNASNAYFIINDITNVSSMDFKNIKMIDNEYMTKKLFKDIEYNVRNKLSILGKDKLISFSFKTYNSYPEKLCGDYLKLKQAIISLVSNSFKYTEKGFIDIEVDTITRYDVCRMIFTIKDSGRGISISKINELLSSNVEIDTKEFEKMDNLELDISVVIKMIKLLGGSISIKSKENKGTIVVVVVDQKIGEMKNSVENSLVKNYKTNIKSKKRILVADDKNNLDKIKRLFTKSEVEVVTTLVGKDVVDKISRGDKFDLIVLEDDMEPDSAYTIFKELKQNKKFNIPVVVMIKKEKEFIKDHFIDDGFSDIIVLENIENDIKRISEKYI